MNRILAILSGAALIFASCQRVPQEKKHVEASGGQPPKPSGSSGDPVVVWAHFMPMVPNANMHAHYEGNNDAWPFNSQSGSAVEDYKEHIRLALESGINGFQMLKVADKNIFEAARQIRAETGKLFYISPEWCQFEDPKSLANTVADFMGEYRGNPHLFLRGEAPLFFTYFSGKWENTPEGVRAFKNQLAERNVSPLLAPTITAAMLLDRTDLGWQAMPQNVRPGPVGWLKLGWEAATFFHADPRPDLAALIQKRLAENAPDFFFIPSLEAGYDSSNRPSQAIRTPYHGLRTLLDGWDIWKQYGYRQFTYATWNDCNETMLVPSSRNVWGYNTILAYFHGLLSEGKSPFAKPEVVVAYPVECIYGDKLTFQVLGLPSADAGIGLRVKVELATVGHGDAVVLEGGCPVSKANDKVFLELDWASGQAIGKTDAFQPRVTVDVRATEAGEWVRLHDRQLLPPIRLSANLVRFPTGYAIALSKVCPDSSLAISVSDDPIARIAVTADAAEPIRRLHLQEGSRSLGVFRPASPDEKVPEGMKRNLFIRIDSTADVPLIFSVDGGTLHDLYTPNSGPSFGVIAMGPPPCPFQSFSEGSAWQAGKGLRTARVDLGMDSKISVSVAGEIQPAITVTPNDLLKGRAVRVISYRNKPVTLALGLTHDGTDPNIDFPLPAKGTFLRDVPLFLPFEGSRLIFASALLASGKVVYSPAVFLESPLEDGKKPVALQWIDTGGAFDDFNRSGYDKTWNPFHSSQVSESSLPKNRIPYYHLDMEEGAGARLNDRGTDHQPGRAWLEQGTGHQHQAAYADESTGVYKWLSEGRRGEALWLGDDVSIRFRSKSSPLGAQTISLWVKASPATDGQTGWKALEADSFRMQLHDNGAFSLTFDRAETTITFPGLISLHEGWNHLAFVYDLKSVAVYHDGKQVGLQADVPPVYQRTHLAPRIHFSQPTSTGIRLTGAIDEVEVVGTGLRPDDILQLSRGVPWLNLQKP